MKRLLRYFPFLLALGLAPALYADDHTHYNHVHLSVSASGPVENDTMVAIVYTEEEGRDVVSISRTVNQKIQQGLALVKEHPGIKYQTNAYSSNPVYNHNKIIGWRVRQSLRLESKDMTLMSGVLGKLQHQLALQSMQFTVSPESKNKQDEKLIDQALEAFNQRAKQVVKKLSKNSYKIIDMDITTTGTRGVPTQYQMRAMAMKADVAPAVSAGEQTLTVRVSGNIELE